MHTEIQHPAMSGGPVKLRPGAPMRPNQIPGRPNTQRGPRPEEQIALNQHKMIAARVIQQISGVPLEDARAALQLASLHLDEQEQRALTPIRLPTYLIKKQECWDDGENRAGVGRVFAIGNNKLLYDSLMESGQYAPADELPQRHMANVAAQARHDLEAKAATLKAQEEQARNEREALERQKREEQAFVERTARFADGQKFSAEGAAIDEVHAFLKNNWPAEDWGPYSTDVLPEDEAELRGYAKQLHEALFAQA